VGVRLRLIKLSAKLQAMLAKGEIDAGVAELVSKFPGEALQGEACKQLGTVSTT